MGRTQSSLENEGNPWSGGTSLQSRKKEGVAGGRKGCLGSRLKMPRFLQGREEQMEKKQKAQSLGHIAQQMQIKAAQVFQKRGAAEEGCCPARSEVQTKTTELLRECEPVGVGAGQKSHSA